jgi:hypothetical protein
MKHTLPVILLFLLLSAISCDKNDVTDDQSRSFLKFYRYYPEFVAADVSQTSSGYAILGTIETLTEGSQICLLKTDAYGNVIDSAYFGRSHDDVAYCLETLDDEGFAILGSSINPETEKSEVYFIRTDADGHVKWSHFIGGSGNVVARHFEISSLGYFIMTGYAEKSSTETTRQLWIGALDGDGNQPYWSPRITASPKNAEGRHIQILSDGSLILTGVTENDPSSTTYSHAFILKATSTGGATDIFFIPATGNETGVCIRALGNDKFLVLGTQTGVTSSSITLKYISLTSRQVEWSKTYNSVQSSQGQSMIFDNNQIFILGTTSLSATSSSITILKTDFSGNLTSEFDYGSGSELSASAFEMTKDGGFIIAGTNDHSKNDISVILIKTRNNIKF